MLHWFSTSARDLPWRRTRDPYAIWVSEIMLQQTQVKTVIPYWERWMRELPTIEAAAKVNPARLHKLWEGLGYYTRVRNLQKAAQQIVAEHHGKFPETFDAVLALPGIGRYTAGAICSIAFNQPTPILDGNVIRVLTRIFGIATDPLEKSTNAQLWQLSGELVATAAEHKTIRNSNKRPSAEVFTLSSIPNGGAGRGEEVLGFSSFKRAGLIVSSGNCSSLNQSLMELGALICTPRSPNCPACPVQKLCVAFRENRQTELPNLGNRAAATERRFIALVAEHRGRFLVRQRPAGVVNAHLWEFPNVEVNGESNPAKIFRALLGDKPVALRKLCTIKHSITRYRITLETHRIRVGRRLKLANGVWRLPGELDALAFTSAHKKVLARLADTLQHKTANDRVAPRKNP